MTIDGEANMRKLLLAAVALIALSGSAHAVIDVNKLVDKIFENILPNGEYLQIDGFPQPLTIGTGYYILEGNRCDIGPASIKTEEDIFRRHLHPI
jgi:hypothetical protein